MIGLPPASQYNSSPSDDVTDAWDVKRAKKYSPTEEAPHQHGIAIREPLADCHRVCRDCGLTRP